MDPYGIEISTHQFSFVFLVVEHLISERSCEEPFLSAKKQITQEIYIGTSSLTSLGSTVPFFPAGMLPSSSFQPEKALNLTQLKDHEIKVYYPHSIPGTQMTLVLVGKDLVLGG